jgi:hypothetical protein
VFWLSEAGFVVGIFFFSTLATYEAAHGHWFWSAFAASAGVLGCYNAYLTARYFYPRRTK